MLYRRQSIGTGMFDESARASEERASHVLFDETARNKQNKSKEESKKRSKEGPEGPFLTAERCTSCPCAWSTSARTSQTKLLM
jgi:hypothetical protein